MLMPWRAETFRLLFFLVGVLLFAAEPGLADVILVPNSISKQIYVLDRNTGDVDSSFSVDSFSSSPIEIIDGPDDSLLLSDQLEAMVFRLDANGSFVNNYLAEPAPQIRGITFFNNVLVGATRTGLFAWDSSGVLKTFHFNGNFFDITQVTPNVLVATDATDDDLEAYRISNGRNLGSTEGGILQSPRQVIRITTTTGTRLAVSSYSSRGVYIYRLNGELDYSFPINSFGFGVIQLDGGNLLITSSAGLSEYTLGGEFIRQILTGNGFRYLSRSQNYVP